MAMYINRLIECIKSLINTNLKLLGVVEGSSTLFKLLSLFNSLDVSTLTNESFNLEGF